jgi:hypothetical protein
MLPAKSFSQQQMPRIGQNSPHPLRFQQNFKEQFFEITFGYPITNTIRSIPLQCIPGFSCLVVREDYGGPYLQILPDYYTSHLPFFCKQEFQFEKATSIPLRVRLGSLEYVNKLEGKK